MSETDQQDSLDRAEVMRRARSLAAAHAAGHWPTAAEIVTDVCDEADRLAEALANSEAEMAALRNYVAAELAVLRSRQSGNDTGVYFS